MFVTIMRPQINTGLQSVFLTCINKFTDYITLTVLPRRILHAIISILTGPQTKAVGMFGSQDGAVSKLRHIPFFF